MINTKTQKAFTMIELVFVIVIIGILSSIAIPKFARTAVMAHDSAASSVLAIVRSALTTEHQRRILRGDYTEITSLGNVFTQFSKAKDNTTISIMDNPPKKCSIPSDTACWKEDNTTTPIQYIYHFSDGGEAVFELSGGKLTCKTGSDCTRLER